MCVGGGLSVTCVTESLGSVKSHAQECLVSSQSLCTGASRPVGDTEAGIPSLDSVELCSRGLCGCRPHICSLLFCVLAHTPPFVSSLLLEPGSPALEWVRAMDCLGIPLGRGKIKKSLHCKLCPPPQDPEQFPRLSEGAHATWGPTLDQLLEPDLWFSP